MSRARERVHPGPIIGSMPTDVDIGDLHRLSLDEYHRLIEAGAFDEFPRVELIDGLLVRTEMKSREHENAIAWLARRLMFGVDQERFEVRVGASLTLANSEPEPDLAVIARASPRPYHPATAALVIEVSVTSLRRDLEHKPALYAQAGVAEYWVVDLAAGRVVVYRVAGGSGYGEVREVRSGERVASPAAGLAALDIDELLRAAAG